MNTTDSHLLWANILINILYGIIFLAGAIGNSLVIYVVVRFPKMNTVTNFYILNLALADLAFIFTVPVWLTYTYYNVWIFGEFICKINKGSMYITSLSSSLFLLTIAADRYVLVCWPAQASRWRTVKHAVIIAVVVWILTVSSGLHFLIYSKVMIDSHTDEAECYVDWNESYESFGVGPDETARFYFFAGFLFPLVFICIFYFLIVKRLRTVGSSTSAAVVACSSQRQRKSEEIKLERNQQNVTNLVLVVIAAFFICWTPFWTHYFIIYYTGAAPTEAMLLMHSLIVAMIYANSAVNPILYAFLSDTFRKTFKKACSCSLFCKNGPNQRDSSAGGSISRERMEQHTTFEMSTI